MQIKGFTNVKRGETVGHLAFKMSLIEDKFIRNTYAC